MAATQVLTGSAVTGGHGKFTVTPKGSEYWIVSINGTLTNSVAGIFAHISQAQIKAAESSMSPAIINDRKAKLQQAAARSAVSPPPL